MSNSKIKIDKVHITVGKQELVLSVDEARELLEVLQKTIKTEDKIVYRESWVYPYTRPWHGDHWVVNATAVQTTSNQVFYKNVGQTGEMLLGSSEHLVTDDYAGNIDPETVDNVLSITLK